MEDKNFELEVMERYGYNENSNEEFEEEVLNELFENAFNDKPGFEVVKYVHKKVYDSYINEFIDDLQCDIEAGRDRDIDIRDIEHYWEKLNDYIYEGQGISICSDSSQDWALITDMDGNLAFYRTMINKADKDFINKKTRNYIQLDFGALKDDMVMACKELKQTLNHFDTVEPHSFTTREELKDAIHKLNRKGIAKVDLSDWDVSNVKDMSGVFYWTSFEKIKGLETWDVSKVEDMSGMFNCCYDLKEIKGIENWDVSSLESTKIMFRDCESLENLDLTGWDTSKVKDTRYMFHYCPLEKQYGVDGDTLIAPPKSKTKISF